MKKISIFIYGLSCYLMFLVVFVYAVGFIGNIKVNNSLDALPGIPFMHALMINLGLLTIFAIQHSGMARKGFKRWITQYIPKSAERATYVLLSNTVMLIMFYFWEPMGGVIWSTESAYLKTCVLTIYMFGWALVLVSTFLINHFHLFGLQQVWGQLIGIEIPTSHFVAPSLYKLVRHPLYVGWIVVVWAAPVMTSAHLVFALMCTAYILIAIQFEEKDLEGEFGDAYKAYKEQVPMIIPSIRKPDMAHIKESI